MVNFKTSKENYKSKRYVFNSPEKQLVFEDYYPAIVDKQTWELAQKLRKTKRRTFLGAPNPLTGILYCADCGAKMTNRRGVRRRGDENGVGDIPRVDSYECSANRLAASRFIKKCSLHFVTTKAVNAMILETIRHVTLYARGNEAEFTEKLREASTVKQADAAKENKRRLAKNERRIAELDMLFKKAFESNAGGKLSDERYAMLTADYEREQEQLREQSAELQAQLDAYEQDSQSAEKFLALAKKYPDFDELTPSMLAEFVDRVYIHEGDRTSGERRQEMDIHLNFIGQFIVPGSDREPTPDELAAAQADLERRIKNRAKHKAWRDKKKAERLAAQNNGEQGA